MSIVPTSAFGRAAGGSPRAVGPFPLARRLGRALAAAALCLGLSPGAFQGRAAAQEVEKAEEPVPLGDTPVQEDGAAGEAAEEAEVPIKVEKAEEEVAPGEIERAEEIIEPPPPRGRIPEAMFEPGLEEELLGRAARGLPPSHARRVRTYYKEAIRAYRARRYLIAVRYCEEALRSDPENLAVQRMLYTAKIAKQKRELRLEAERAHFLDEDALADVDRETTFPEKRAPLPRPELPLRENVPKSPRLRRMQQLLNQRVSMNFIEADLDYVLQTLFKISGVDIIAEQSVIADKTLTLHVEDVPLREILDFVKRNYEGVEYTVTENAVWLVTPEKPPLLPRTYPLSRGIVSSAGFKTGVRTTTYRGGAGARGGGASSAGPQSLAGAASGAGGKAGESHLESVLTWIESWEDEWPANSQWYLDRQTNSLMVLTTPEMHERIEEMLDVMDTVPIQVLVRTKFIEVRAEDMKELGLGFLFLEQEQVKAYKEMQTAADLPGVLAGNLNFRRLYTMGSGGVVVDIQALLEDKRTKVLSAPQIIAMNNTPAQIDISKSFSYATSYDLSRGYSHLPGGQTVDIPSAFIPAKFEDVTIGFFLEFMPSVGRDMKNIVLDLHARVDDILGNIEDFTEVPIMLPNIDLTGEGGAGTTLPSTTTSGAGGFQRPVIDSREFTTKLVIEDGGTVIIGGLLKNNREVLNRKVPILGDIPLIGLLFRARKEVTVQSNLIIVVQADIVEPSGRTYARPSAEAGNPSRGSMVEPEWFTEFEPQAESGVFRGYGARSRGGRGRQLARTVTGIDVGRESIKTVSLRSQGGVPELDRVAAESLGELARLEEGPEKLAALTARLGRLVRDHQVPVRECVTGISGRTTIIRYIQVPPVPPWRLEALMRFEATQQSASHAGDDVPALDRVFDHRMLDVPDVDGQSTVLLALSQESNVEERVSLLGGAGVEDPDVDLVAMGLYNAYIHGHGFDESDADRNIMLLDIGAEEMHIVIVRNGGLLFARHHQGGANRFTRAIEELKPDAGEDAEEYKRTKARIYADPSEAPSDEDRRMSEALAREAADLERAVEATLLYARAQTKIRDIDVGRILVSGGGSQLAGLRESFAMRFRTEGVPLEPFRRISMGDASPETLDFVHNNAAALAVSVGLALSRLEPRSAKLDLRLESAKEARTFAQRGVFLRAAAVVFAVGLVFWMAGAVRDRFVYAGARAAARELVQTDEGALKELLSRKARNRQLATEIEALRERVTSGEDILRALSQIKKRTPGSIRLISFSTRKPAGVGRAEEEKEEATFQSRRLIYLRGYARSRSSYSDAVREIWRYRNALRDLEDLFEKVEQRKLLQSRAGEGGSAHVAEFVLELRIAKPK